MNLTSLARPGPPNRTTRPVPAAGSSSVRAVVDGSPRPGELIAVFPTALYVRLARGQVIAVLTHDAVRLPCALVLATASMERPLHGVRGEVLVGAAQVRIGALAVEISRLVSFTAPVGLSPRQSAVAQVAAVLSASGFREHGSRLDVRLRAGCRDPRAARQITRALLGAGSGLTPSGDDVLAGFLVGAHVFGIAADPLRRAVQVHAPGATTDLSATLLDHAVRGESIPQVTSLLRQLAAEQPSHELDHSLARLLRVGHSSGIALATGIHAAARIALAPEPLG